MAKGSNKIALFARAAILTFACTLPAAGVEDGMSPYAKGFVGFMSGYVPTEAGLNLSGINYYFAGSAGTNTRNGFVEFGINTTSDADFLQALYVTNWSLLGGQYAFGGAVGWAWVNLSANLNSPIGGLHVSLNNNAFTDSIWTPALFAWHQGAFSENLALNVYAPTGFYSPHITTGLSIGKNIWSFMPQYSVTWFDPTIGWDVSGSLIYVTQSFNNATDYQSGDLIHLDWAIGYRFGADREWEAGVAGNLVEQISPDTGAGAKLGSFEASSSGIGPGISWSTKYDGVPISLGARWERDFYARNTFKGDVAEVTVAASF